MIVKDKVVKNTNKKHLIQGEKAEKQMSFYLKRKFSESKDFYIFNDLKIEHNGEIAQIDHLVVSYFGFFIIESKSCVGEISYDNFDQWIRVYQNKREGMPSPIEQAKRQYAILKEKLNENKENLQGKFLFLQKKFGWCVFEPIVAISDETIMRYPGKVNPNVLKADKVTGFIENKIKEYKKQNVKATFFPVLDEKYKFKEEELIKVVEYIKEVDLNKKKEYVSGKKYFKKIEDQSSPNDKSNDEDVKELVIIEDVNVVEVMDSKESSVMEQEGTCSEHSFEIVYGKYGYYFKCKVCNENKQINEKCSNCNKKMKIKKIKHNFLTTCEHCSTESQYWTNK